MIVSFKHKGLQDLFTDGKSKAVDPKLVKKILRQLDALDAAKEAKDVAMWGLHQLKGDRKGTWSIKASANDRITFKIESGEVRDVDLEDYH